MARCLHVTAGVIARSPAKRARLVDQKLPTPNDRVIAAAAEEASESGVLMQDGEEIIDDGRDAAP